MNETLAVLIGILIASNIISIFVGIYYQSQHVRTGRAHLHLNTERARLDDIARINEENKNWLQTWENELQERENVLRKTLNSESPTKEEEISHSVEEKDSSDSHIATNKKATPRKKISKLARKKKSSVKKAVKKSMKRKSSKKSSMRKAKK